MVKSWAYSYVCSLRTHYILLVIMGSNFFRIFCKVYYRISKSATTLHRTCLGAGGSRNWLFAAFYWNWGLHWLVLFSTYPILLYFSTHLRIMVQARRVHCHQPWIFLQTRVMDSVCTYRVTHWPLSWTVASEISIFLFWGMMKRCVHILENKANVKVLVDLKNFLMNCIHANYV